VSHSPVFTTTLIIAMLAGACSSSRDAAGDAEATVEDSVLSNGIDTTALAREVEVRDVEPIDVERDELRPLGEMSGDDVPIPTVMVAGLDLEPITIREDGIAFASADEKSNDRSFSIQRAPYLVDDPPEPDERVLVVAGVSWQISTFENLTFATAADPGVSILGRGLDQDTIEAVLNGLRSGPLDAFPTGSYDIDDGADTVFRTADGEVSLDYTTVRDAPCWTLRGPGWLFGDCARSRAPTGGAVVLQRYAPIRPDGTIDTVMYTAGFVPPDVTAVEVAGFDGVVERVEVADLSGDHGAKFFIARSGFDPDRDVSTTTVTVIE